MKPLTYEWVEKAEGVEFRYPGASAGLEIAKDARSVRKTFRAVARHSLGLPK